MKHIILHVGPLASPASPEVIECFSLILIAGKALGGRKVCFNVCDVTACTHTHRQRPVYMRFVSCLSLSQRNELGQICDPRARNHGAFPCGRPLEPDTFARVRARGFATREDRRQLFFFFFECVPSSADSRVYVCFRIGSRQGKHQDNVKRALR